MRRIMYISSLSTSLSDDEIRSIGRISSRNNKKIDVTGVLLFAHEFFFQILEGEQAIVESLVEKIRRDPRHRDFLILKCEDGVSTRLFPNWSMRTVRLEESQGMILQAVRLMLETIAESHRIIERYTQPSVLHLLTQGINPLEIPPKAVDRIILFGDMVGFSLLSERFPTEEVTLAVNTYLELCSKRIIEFGGEVSKYIGDCVMAHFPAEAPDAAIEACVKALGDLQHFRAGVAGGRLRKYLFGGFGLTRGQVIEGNIGSTIKMDYTILGEEVNRAQRLESLTRVIHRALAVSRAVRENAKSDWGFECAGEFELKGHSGTCPVYTIADPVVADFRDSSELALMLAAAPDGPLAKGPASPGRSP